MKKVHVMAILALNFAVFSAYTATAKDNDNLNIPSVVIENDTGSPVYVTGEEIKALASAGALNSLDGQVPTNLDSSITLEIIPSGAPASDSLNRDVFYANGMEYIRFGGPQGDPEMSPTGYKPVRFLEWVNLCSGTSASGYNYWRGATSSGIFAGEFGNRTFFSLVLKSPNRKVDPRWVSFETDSSDAARSLRFTGNIATNLANGQEVTFSSTLIGVDYGPDGRKNTADDQIYNSGTLVPVNEIVYIGVRMSYTATSATAVSQVKNYILANSPMFWLKCRYFVSDGEGIIASGEKVIDIMGIVEMHKIGSQLFVKVQGQPTAGTGANASYSIQASTFDAPIRWDTVATSLYDDALYQVPLGTNAPTHCNYRLAR